MFSLLSSRSVFCFCREESITTEGGTSEGDITVSARTILRDRLAEQKAGKKFLFGCGEMRNLCTFDGECMCGYVSCQMFDKYAHKFFYLFFVCAFCSQSKKVLLFRPHVKSEVSFDGNVLFCASLSVESSFGIFLFTSS